MSERITLKTLAASIDDLARMVADGFTHQREEVRAEVKSLDLSLRGEISRLDAKIDYRFDTLSNRMDDFALNKISRDEHRVLAARVSDLEEKLT